MTTASFVNDFEAYSQWRQELSRRIVAYRQWLGRENLNDSQRDLRLQQLVDRLAEDKLHVAFIAEFSRGKSELINAIFFADAGRRVLPATPGRTTMCPVELRFEADMPPRLALLPIETRLRGLSLAEMRQRDEHWHLVPLDPRSPPSLVQALAAVTRTQRVSVAQAAALGFWDESQPEDNPQLNDDGSVDVPAWRHAVINYPHPLLQRGLVVIDTPGLNAIGAEPELTLGLLPSAHAVVFVLAADTGVTRSDLSIWRDHLGQASLERFVVLNKIDTLQDPLLSPDEVVLQIEQQRLGAAHTLGVAQERVFALSARDALAARLADDNAGLVASRLPPLEAALATELLPRRQELLVKSAVLVVEQLRASTARRLNDRRRQQAEQLLELRGLRGKSGAKMRMMVERVDAEVADFERCTAKLAALRAVQQRILREAMAPLASESLRSEVAAMQSAMGAKPFNLGGSAAFATLMSRMHAAVDKAARQAEEMRQMLEASFRELNTEFGFAFALGPVPPLGPFQDSLDTIDQNYRRYLGLGQVWRMAAPGFAEQFRRMLVAKLRVVFENAAGELELWSKAAQGQVEVQLRERRRNFTRRREALQRVQGAAGELEQRIAEVQAQDEHLAKTQARLDALAADTVTAARSLGSPAALAVQAANAPVQAPPQQDAA